MDTMQLLAVRLKVPKPRVNYIARTGLYHKLHKINENKVIVIKAGAGSGKTTLLSAFIKDEQLKNVKWITLDETMNQAFVFWNYVFEANKDLFGVGEDKFRSMINGGMQKEILWNMIYILVNQLETSEERYIIFDDFWHITDPFLLKTMEYFIANSPDQIHIVLITRVMPEIYLGTLTLEGRALLIEEDELRFSKEESRKFLEHTLGRPFEKAQEESMIEESNGWIGGLQLMALAGHKDRGKRLLPVHAKQQVIFEYIKREIYDHLGEEVKDFLKKTAILPYLSEEVCKRLLPEYDFTKMITAIINQNLFIIQIEEGTEEFRYHSILKEFLLHLYEGDEMEKRILCNKAATIYYDLGAFEESIEELFMVHLYELAMDELLHMPQNSVTYSYMMKVPREEIVKNMDFAYQYFFCYYAALEVETCREIYQTIMQSDKKNEMIKVFQNADYFLTSSWRMGDIKSVSLEQIEQIPVSDVSKAYLLIKEAYFLFVEDKIEEANKYLCRAEKLNSTTENEYIQAFILLERTQIQEKTGYLKDALMEYKRIEQIVKLVPTMVCSYYIGIAGVHTYQLRLKEAKEELDKANEVMKQGVEDMYNAYLYTLVQYDMAIGNEKEAAELLSEISKKVVYNNYYFVSQLLENPIYEKNNRDKKQEFIKGYETNKESKQLMEVQLSYARVIADDRPEESMEQINELLVRARKCQNKRIIVEAGIHKLYLLQNQEDKEDQLLDLLYEVMTYVCQEEMGYPVRMNNELLPELLKRYESSMTKRLSKQNYAYILSLLKLSNESKDELNPLTEREEEVVNEILKGYTNKQAADHLCISVATVKTHLINIYSKLGVSNRVEVANYYNEKHKNH